MTTKREFPDWEQLYQNEPVEQMPWYYPQLDHDCAQALAELKLTQGTVLDLGTGPATQAIALVQHGFTVTATDISATAIAQAQQRALASGCAIEFLQDDILKSQLDKKFDLVVDRGCFHVMHPEHRATCIHALAARIKSGGYLLLKCFSHLETMEGGPYRFSPKELTQLFSPKFKIHSITASEFKGSLETAPKALFSVMVKP